MATLAEQTTQSLRAAILGMRLPPGHRLVERDLAEQEQVSRTCVRAALQALEAEGLVLREQRRGFVVATLSADEARQIYELRTALEPAMARLFVARASPSERQALTSAAAAAAAAAERDDEPAFVRAHTEFYDILLTGAANDIARQVLATLHARITYLRTLTTQRSYRTRRLRTAALLQNIAEAASAGQADRAARACAAFVRRSLRFALQVLDGR
jgi:GntR family transcriptional regulator, trigonelline degradation regulator